MNINKLLQNLNRNGIEFTKVEEETDQTDCGITLKDPLYHIQIGQDGSFLVWKQLDEETFRNSPLLEEEDELVSYVRRECRMIEPNAEQLALVAKLENSSDHDQRAWASDLAPHAKWTLNEIEVANEYIKREKNG